MAQKLESGPMQIKHGHTDTHVIISFSRPTDHVLLTEAQLEAFNQATKGSLERLKEHMAKKGKSDG